MKTYEKEKKAMKHFIHQRKSFVRILLEAEALVLQRILDSGRKLSFDKVSDPIHALLDHTYASLFQVNRFYKKLMERITHELYGKKVPKDQTPERTAEKISKKRIKKAKKAVNKEQYKFMAQEELDETYETKTQQEEKVS